MGRGGGGGGGKNTFISVKNGRGIAVPAPSPPRSLEFYHMQFICIMRNLCESKLDAISCYCYNKHVCSNQIGKVLTNQTDMDIDKIN